MTSTPFDDGQMDQAGAELMMRERFDAAVGALSPDIGRLVADGTAEGRGAVRRRRIVSGIAAAAVAIVAVGSISYASQSDLFGKGDHAANNTKLEELVPATPRGLAAAVITHTGSLGTPIAVWGGHTSFLGLNSPALTAELGYVLDDGTKVDLTVIAVDSGDDPGSGGNPNHCDPDPGGPVCDEISLSDGTTGLYYEYAAHGDPQTASGMWLRRDDGSTVGATESLVEPGVLPLDKAALIELLTDPLVGASTTAAMNAAGEDIANFQMNPGGASSSGSATASPPTVETQPAQPRGTGDSSSATSR
jgi:hypothetical protein